jgi:hypothetical protein
MEGKAMHDKKDLCAGIRSLCPPIGECGIGIEANFDEAKKVWAVDSKKEEHQRKTLLEPPGADSCLEGKQCVSLGLQIAQLVANIQSN